MTAAYPLANQGTCMAFDADLEQPTVPAEVASIDYMESAAAPGLRLFRCEPYRATLSTKACAGRWLKALDAYGDYGSELAKCKTCSIGSAHAGRGMVRYSAWYGVSVCPRCQRGTTRMIGNRRCVSCYNRERELKAGKNARGNKPVELMARPLRTIEVMLEVDGQPRRLKDHNTQSMVETMLQTLRTTKGELAFGFAGQIPPGGAAAAVAAPARPVDGGAAGLATASDPQYVWGITARRCDACSGRILERGGPDPACRCADCGQEGPGHAEEAPVPAASDGADAPNTAPRPGCMYRARLLASTAIVPSAGVRPG